MVRCIVCGNDSSYHKEIEKELGRAVKFFIFPRIEEDVERWRQRLELGPDIKITDDTYVCSVHFSDDDPLIAHTRLPEQLRSKRKYLLPKKEESSNEVEKMNSIKSSHSIWLSRGENLVLNMNDSSTGVLNKIPVAVPLRFLPTDVPPLTLISRISTPQVKPLDKNQETSKMSLLFNRDHNYIRVPSQVFDNNNQLCTSQGDTANLKIVSVTSLHNEKRDYRRKSVLAMENTDGPLPGTRNAFTMTKVSDITAASSQLRSSAKPGTQEAFTMTMKSKSEYLPLRNIKKHREKCLLYRRKVKVCKALIQRRTTAIAKLKEEILNLQNVQKEAFITTSDLTDTIEGELFTNCLVKMKEEHRKPKFSAKFKAWALALFFYSSKAYDFINCTFHGALPSKETLKKLCVNNHGFSPGDDFFLRAKRRKLPIHGDGCNCEH